MIRLLFYCMILFPLFSGCRKKQPVIRALFEINHKINCQDLTDQGYQWMPGEDVILLGKRTGDTLDYYQVEENMSRFRIDEETEDRFLLSENEYMVDTSVYFPHLEFVSVECKGGRPIWRLFKIGTEPHKAIEYLKNLDKKRYRILDAEINEDSTMYSSKVVNISTLDTFYCAVNKELGRFYLTSSINMNRQ